MVWKYNALDHITQRHNDLLDSVGLDPHYRSRNPRLFLEGEDLAAIEEKVQGNPVSKKRRR